MAIKVWAHGDYPTAAQMNEYKTVLDAAKAALNAGSPALPMQVAAEHASSGEFWVWHCYRYLHYGSNGVLVDQDGVYPDVSLSEDDNQLGVLDLDSLGWLQYGRVYKVTGVTWCQEDWEP